MNRRFIFGMRPTTYHRAKRCGDTRIGGGCVRCKLCSSEHLELLSFNTSYMK